MTVDAITDPELIRRSRLVRLRHSMHSTSGKELRAGALVAISQVWSAPHPEGGTDHRVAVDDGDGGRITLWLSDEALVVATSETGSEGLAGLPVLVGHTTFLNHLAAVSGLSLDELHAFAVTIARATSGGSRATVLIDGELVWHGFVMEPSEQELVQLVKDHVLGDGG